jgi:hypothetical protein
MFRVHFPDDSGSGQCQQKLGICGGITNRGDWNLTKQVINQTKIRWALSTFKPFKSVGTDAIVHELLQQGAEYLVPQLCCTFRACRAYGLIPMAWRQVRMMFITKLKKADSTEDKTYRPISLSSYYGW